MGGKLVTGPLLAKGAQTEEYVVELPLASKILSTNKTLFGFILYSCMIEYQHFNSFLFGWFLLLYVLCLYNAQWERWFVLRVLVEFIVG